MTNNDEWTPIAHQDEWKPVESPVKEGVVGEIGSFMTGVGKVVPFGQDIPAAISAGRSYLGMHPKGVPESGTFAERFSGAKKAQEEAAKVAGEKMPLAQRAGMATGIVGSIAPLGGVGAAEEAAAAALTKAAPSIITKTLPNAAPASIKGATSIASGAGMGAAYGIGEGNTLEERLKNAKTGAEIGTAISAASPLVGAGVGAAAKAVSEYLPGFISGSEKAGLKKIEEAIKTDVERGRAGLTPQEIQKAQSRGQPILPIDIGGRTLQQEARTAANLYPEAEATLTTPLRERYEQQQARYRKSISDMMPFKVEAAEVEDALRDVARKVNAPAYKLAYQKGSSGIWNKELETLANSPAIQETIPGALKKSANRAALEGTAPVKNPFILDETGKMVLPPGQKPTLEFWDTVKRSLDDDISALKRSGKEDEAKDLNNIRIKLLNNLDTAVDEYRIARAGASKAFAADNAFDAGLNFMSLKDTLELSQAKKALAKMSKNEREIFSHGVASDLIQKIKNKGVGKDISSMFDSPDSREKLMLALGPKRSKELEAFTRVENIMADAHKALVSNSTTAKQTSRMGNLLSKGKDIAGELGAIYTGSTIGGPLGGAAAFVAKHFLSHLSNVLGEKATISMAEKLVSGSPEDIQAVANMIASNPNAMRQLRLAPTARQAATQAGEEIHEPRAKRASGGRTGSAMTADKLIAMAERAKNKINSSTKPLLDQPDEVIVSALKVAHRHI